MLASFRRHYCALFSPSISFHSYLVSSFFQTWFPLSLLQNLLYHLFHPWDFYPFDEAQSHLYPIKTFNFASAEPSSFSFLWSPGVYPHAFFPWGFSRRCCARHRLCSFPADWFLLMLFWTLPEDGVQPSQGALCSCPAVLMTHCAPFNRTIQQWEPLIISHCSTTSVCVSQPEHCPADPQQMGLCWLKAITVLQQDKQLELPLTNLALPRNWAGNKACPCFCDVWPHLNPTKATGPFRRKGRGKAS